MREDNNLDIINISKADGDVIYDFVLYFLTQLRKNVVCRFFRDKMTVEDRKFAEYLLIDVARGLLNQLDPWVFYRLYTVDSSLRNVLDLKYLGRLDQYLDYNRKRKNLRVYLDKIIKRNLKLKEGEIYIVDTSVVEVDLNRLRNGRKIKEMFYDVEFMHSSSKGSVVAFLVATVINFTNLEVVEVRFFPKNAKKTEIWEEMVIDKLGTQNGKIKVVIADGGFFAYDNIMISPNYRIIPVIKVRRDISPDKIEAMLKNLPPNIVWFDSRYNKVFSELITDFSEIVRETIYAVRNYEEFARMRSEIELIFKVAKLMFGINSLHVYYRDMAKPKVFFAIYMASLFCQFCKIKKVSINRITHVLEANTPIF